MRRSGGLPQRLVPGPARPHYWADLTLWRELWAALFGKSVAAHVEEGLRMPTEASESPPGGSWADPSGPGRCPRCRAWLTGPGQVRWRCHFRQEELSLASFILCADCTYAVLDKWGIER